MKKRVCLALVACLLASCACAEVIPPEGEVQGYQEFTGIVALRGVVLCESLTVRDGPAGKALDTLYNGDTFMTWESFDGHVNVSYADGSKTGWVAQEYVIIDPAYYVTEKATPAYAYGAVDAPRVGLLDAGEKLPILLETEAYYVVALRGASAWIRKEEPAAVLDTASLEDIVSATLRMVDRDSGETDGTYVLTDETRLDVLSALLTDVTPVGFGTKCPFHCRLLDISCGDGTSWTLDLAGDSCTVFILNGTYWTYGASRDGLDSELLFSLFEAGGL